MLVGRSVGPPVCRLVGLPVDRSIGGLAHQTACPSIRPLFLLTDSRIALLCSTIVEHQVLKSFLRACVRAYMCHTTQFSPNVCHTA